MRPSTIPVGGRSGSSPYAEGAENDRGNASRPKLQPALLSQATDSEASGCLKPLNRQF
jgi:hypothetical protein